MITQLTFSGYRSFSKPTAIPLRKLTLLLGPNSSGKTSVISALSLLRQTVDEPGYTPGLVMRGRARLADLGTYRDIVTDGDLNRKLEIGILFTDSLSRSDTEMPPRDSQELTNERDVRGWERVLFGRNESTMGLKASWAYDPESKWLRAQTISLFAQDFEHKLVGFSTDEAVLADTCQLSDIDGVGDLWREEFEFYRIYATQSFEKVLIERWEETVAALFGLEYGDGSVLDFRKKISSGEGVTTEARDFFALGRSLIEAVASNKFDQFVECKEKQWKWGLHRLHRFLPGDPLFRDETWGVLPFDGIDQAIRTACTIPESHDFFNIPGVVSSISTKLRAELSSIEPLGPLRGKPERFYSGKEIELNGVGHGGEDVAEFLAQNPSVVESVNEWMQRLGAGHVVRPEVVANGRGVTLMMKDLHRSKDVEVTYADVGFGISQSLPIVVQCLSANDKLITIEQPEVHIHPRLQSNIADLLLEAVRLGNQCVVETHSEHLVLRLLRRIREGSFDSKDLQVLYIERGSHGSEVLPIEISSTGELLTDWPGGFFEERLDELF